jgi:hypothetical protein
MVRTKDTARGRPSAAAPRHAHAHARTGAACRRSGYPVGVSKTLSGKFQARIKLNGKRYDLGSNFTTPEEAGAAYDAAKQAGMTNRPSPKHARIKRGTGASSCPSLIPLICPCYLLILFARVRVVRRRKGFEGAQYSGAASASRALQWLPGQRAAAAHTAAAARQPIDSCGQSPRRRSRGVASRMPRTCPAGRASPKASERTRCPLCIIPRRAGRAAVRVSEGTRPEQQYIYGLSYPQLIHAYPRRRV